MVEGSRSELACPVCGQHSLAVDEPPRIDVMGVQPYSDMLGMGDLGPAMLPGIVCLSCGTRWRDRDAFDRGEAEPAEDEGDLAADGGEVAAEGEAAEA
jgi:hypothetical protein